MVHLAAGEWGQALLPEYVFLEVVTVLRARLDAESATKVGTTLLEAADIDLVPCSDVFADAWKIFRNEGDRELSFADAAIVAIARREKAKFIATFDQDFRGLSGVSLVPEN
jgi:predicted nucleic acid-binding protein